MMRYKNLEARLLKTLGMRRFAGSGRGLAAEDGTDGFWHAQLKVTAKDSYRLNAEDILKLEQHAFMNAQVPLFAIFFAKTKVFVLIFPVKGAGRAKVKVLRKSIKIAPQRQPVFLQHGSTCWKVCTVPAPQAKRFLDTVRSSAAEATWL